MNHQYTSNDTVADLGGDLGVPRNPPFSTALAVVTMASNVYFGTCKCYSVFMSENPTARQKRGARRRSQKLRSAASLSCALTGSITYSHNICALSAFRAS